MSLLLRVVRQNRWLKAPAEPWLATGDVPADTLSDMQTTGHCLSVWKIDQDRSNLERVVSAVAAKRDKVDNLDYILFDSSLIDVLGIPANEVKGGTDDEVANDWHRDLINLSGLKIVGLVKLMLEKGDNFRISKKKIKALVLDGIQKKEIQMDNEKFNKYFSAL